MLRTSTLARAVKTTVAAALLTLASACGADVADPRSAPPAANLITPDPVTPEPVTPDTVTPDTVTPDTVTPEPVSTTEPPPVATDDIAVEALPARIIPVDGDLAEIVFALGYGDQVVATDISATFPVAADALPEVGYQRALAAEPILEFEPTIVLATDLAGPAETLDDLERLGVRVVVVPSESTPSGPGDKIRAVADALGDPQAGERLAATVDASIAAARDRGAAAADTPTVGALYVRGENVQLLLGEGAGVDWMIEAAGGVDIAAELGVVDNAPINVEALIAAAPDFLIVPERGLESVGGLDGLLEIPGIAQTPAGRDGRILVYDDQYLLGNGPRTGAFLDELITDLHGDIS